MDYLYAHVSRNDVVIDTTTGDSLTPGILIKYDGKFIPNALETVFGDSVQILPYIDPYPGKPVVISTICSRMLMCDHVCSDIRKQYILINTFGYVLYIRYCGTDETNSLIVSARCHGCERKLNLANYNWPHHITPIAECSLYPICECCYNHIQSGAKKICPKCTCVWCDKYGENTNCPNCSTICDKCNDYVCTCVKQRIDKYCKDCNVILTDVCSSTTEISLCNHESRCECHLRCDNCNKIATKCKLCHVDVSVYCDVTRDIKIEHRGIKYDLGLIDGYFKIKLSEDSDIHKAIKRSGRDINLSNSTKSKVYVCMKCIHKRVHKDE